MTSCTTLSNGIVLSDWDYATFKPGASLIISQNSKFWKLSPEEKIRTLEQSRGYIESFLLSSDIEGYFQASYYYKNIVVEALDLNEKTIELFHRYLQHPVSMEEPENRVRILKLLEVNEELRSPRCKPRQPRKELRQKILERDGDYCRYCGTHVSGSKLHIDHITPWSRGGATVEENLVVCCDNCNSKKNILKPEEAGMVLLPIPE